MTAIQNRPSATPDRLDKSVFSDTSDSNNVKQNTLGQIVRAGIQDPSVTTDALVQGTNNLYLSIAEKAKLTGIQAGAQQNAVTSVNTLQGAVVLTQDEILDGANYVQTENNFTDTDVTQLGTAYSHSQNVNGNPHNTTKTMVGLGNVTNDKQLSTTAGNFSPLLEKPDTQYHLDDMSVIQDSADSNNIKKVSNKTNLIWNAGYIQEWGTSINYNKFTFTSSTTYNIVSVITINNKIYKCNVSHQSTTFASDLAAGYWTLIGSPTGGSGNTITVGVGAPTTPYTGATGDEYINSLNDDLYYRNGTAWIGPINGGGTGGVNYQTSPTVGNKIIFSIGIGANLIEETIISRNQTTNTRDWGNTTQTGITNFDTNYEANYNGSVLNFTDTDLNFINSTIDLDATSTLTNNGDTILQDVDINGDLNVDGNTTLNNITINGTITGAGTVGSDEKLQATRTAINQDIVLPTIPRSGIKSLQITVVGGIIQISPTDYSYTAGTNTVRMLIAPPVNPTTIEIQYPIKDALVSGTAVKVGPITRTPAGSSLVITDVNSVATSIVTGDNITSGTTNGNYFVYNMSTPGQITVTSKDFLGNSISENGIQFYYSIVY